MDNIIRYIMGYITITLRGAAPEWALNRLSDANIYFWNVKWHDSFTVSFCIGKKSGAYVEQYVAAAMCELLETKEAGLLYNMKWMVCRPLIPLSVIFSLLMLFVLPQYILFYQVIGNGAVDQEQILQSLDTLGVGVGSVGIRVQPQWLKNNLLELIPDLEWATIVQNGCRAQIIVREREHIPQTAVRKGYANVIATQDGIITEQNVLTGQPVAEVGDTVIAGDLLISGLVDLERTYSVVRAEGEVYARTWRYYDAVTPMTADKKSYTDKQNMDIWLMIGEKRIKIYGNSGIPPMMCDKIITKSWLTLPGNLELPVGLTVVTHRTYKTVETELTETVADSMLQNRIVQLTEKDMIAGTVLSQSHSLQRQGDLYLLSSVLECHEMIASTVDVKWNQEEFVHDGTIRERGESGADH